MSATTGSPCKNNGAHEFCNFQVGFSHIIKAGMLAGNVMSVFLNYQDAVTLFNQYQSKDTIIHTTGWIQLITMGSVPISLLSLAVQPTTAFCNFQHGNVFLILNLWASSTSTILGLIWYFRGTCKNNVDHEFCNLWVMSATTRSVCKNNGACEFCNFWVGFSHVIKAGMLAYNMVSIF